MLCRALYGLCRVHQAHGKLPNSGSVHLYQKYIKGCRSDLAEKNASRRFASAYSAGSSELVIVIIMEQSVFLYILLNSDIMKPTHGPEAFGVM